ncbi:hypothetical protein ACT691_15245 [Vibrio metschnikovii]
MVAFVRTTRLISGWILETHVHADPLGAALTLNNDRAVNWR